MSSLAEARGGEILLYEAPDGEARVDVRLERETVWLNREQMSNLFGRERSVITKHVRNVFREGELEASAVCAKFAHCRFRQARQVLQPRRNHLGRLSREANKDLMIRLIVNLLAEQWA